MKDLLFVWMGAHALAVQVVLVRESLVVLSGHEICLGVLLATWLLGVFSGAWAGGRLAVRVRRPLVLFLGAQAMAVLLAPALVVAVRQLNAWMATTPGVPIPLLPTLLASAALMAPTSFLVGLLFPAGSRILPSAPGAPARPIARLYVLEALGSLVAGVLLTFFLLASMDGLMVTVVAGFPVLGTAAACAWRECRPWGIALASLGGLWVLAVGLGGFQSWRDASLEARWKAQHPGLERLATRDSPYQCVEIGRLENQFSLFGNGHLLATFPDPHGVALLAHLIMNQPSIPRDVLLIGGGPGSLVSILLKYGARDVRIMELDPLVFRLASPFFGQQERAAMTDPRVQVSFVDGRYGIKALPPRRFDAVVVQMPDPATALLNRYHTVEFFREVQRVLRPQGFLAHGIVGTAGYVGEALGAYVGSFHRTLREVFAQVVAAPGDRILFLAGGAGGGLTLDHRRLSQTYLARGLALDPALPEAFPFWLQEGPIQRLATVLAAGAGEVNRDARPRAYLRYLEVWEQMHGSRSAQSSLALLREIPFPWMLAFLALCPFLALLGPRGVATGRAPSVAMAITGFSGMGQEILCLYVYQALQGHLFSRLAWIVALFMAGLCVGGWMGARRGPDAPGGTLWALLGVQGLLTLLCAGIPLGWVPAFFGPGRPMAGDGALELLVGGWMGLAGLGTGLTFALVCRIQGVGGASVGGIAGRVNALDHLGAALGAVLMGTFLMPVFGVTQAGTLLAVLQGGSVVILGLNVLAIERRTGIRSA